MTMKLLPIAVLLAAAAMSAAATPTFYTDEASFRAAAPALTLESFEYPFVETYSTSVYSEIQAVSSGGLYRDHAPTDGVRNLWINTSTLTFTRFIAPAKFTAFAIDVVKLVAEQGDIYFGVDGGSATIAADRTGQVYYAPLFLGVIDPDGFSTVTLLPTLGGDLLAFDRLQSSTLAIGRLGGGVPEPTSWALLIAGFGLTGAALRRRQHQLSVVTA